MTGAMLLENYYSSSNFTSEFSYFDTYYPEEENISELTRNQTRSVSGQIKVLIVDDLDNVRESLRTSLTLEDDIQVVGEASFGHEAVESARRLHPDIVIMDLEMPNGDHFDGINACEQIKSEKLAKAVILLTIHSDFVSRRRAEEAKCDLFLEKGISSMELVEQVRRVYQK